MEDLWKVKVYFFLFLSKKNCVILIIGWIDMLEKVFINDCLSQAIDDYLKYKEKPDDPLFQTFPVMVIRTLIFIYGELDVINPYITQNEHNMGGFDSNLAKFGFSKEKIQDFKDSFIKFQEEVSLNKQPNTAFIKIEKYLIDMYFWKQKTMNLPLESQQEFRKYLYLEENDSVIIQNDLNLYCQDKTELERYFKSVSYEMIHNFSLEELRRSTLNPEAYLLLGYSLEQISGLNDLDLQKVNQQVFQFFRVDPNLEDHQDLLLKAINYYKKYGNRVTSGNGYVDFLLFASVLATALMVTAVVLFHM